jgi:hypothetical protein
VISFILHDMMESQKDLWISPNTAHLVSDRIAFHTPGGLITWVCHQFDVKR